MEVISNGASSFPIASLSEQNFCMDVAGLVSGGWSFLQLKPS